ncbi:MAG: sigma-54 dependent transcriptional regulator [Planctomycetaceae bacterium]|jgi:two-component system NtrC family response regulator|nr:sigma-54 dependent transcriptional regulator [Planctomycetaceae bacterium]
MKILFADDEISLQELMRLELPRMGHTVTVCPDGRAAISVLEKESFDCLLLDLDMPGATGLEVISAAKELSPHSDAVIMTGKGTLDSAVSAIHYGVSDYITKPPRLKDIEMVLKRIAEKREWKNKYIAAQNQLQRIEGGMWLVGESDPMQRVYYILDRIAPTESTVVILGETGTGKELVARAIHDRSQRKNKPFVAVNCGALPETLIESELFGHRKGSFTGANEHRAGLFEVADGGTLFLDEIGELPKGVQSKLLRFLESGEVRKIGENAPIICNVRVVCATLKNLETMVEAGDFREDLWFRINTFEIHIPPLRERTDDLSELIAHLAKRYHEKINIKSGEDLFTPEAFKILQGYKWPGNVRQLANVIEHALILADRLPVGVDELPSSIKPKVEYAEHATVNHDRITERRPNRPIINKSELPEATGPIAELLSFEPGLREGERPKLTLRDMEMDAIQQALQRNEGNKAKAAEELGISTKTLYNKLHQSDTKKEENLGAA